MFHIYLSCTEITVKSNYDILQKQQAGYGKFICARSGKVNKV